MNLDIALIIAREVREHTASAERATSLGEVQEFGDRAVKTLEPSA
jgi:hypothetical protein